ncbi:RidA family protein [Hyphomicrobium sp.]|uniref:RidA family protein n=1 Tax=Hyphomicrobium sp. TaxID=82 RepID=UPI002FDF8DF1
MQTIATDAAPEAIGPYCQAIAHAGLLYCSGQIPLDPATMKIVEGGIVEQTERVFANMEAVLRAAGSDLSKVLKTTVFLSNLEEFPQMNAIFARAFGDHRPARSTVQVARLPLDARVEIECIATLT